MRILLLGGTDLTLAIAQRLVMIGFTPVGVVHIGDSFRISYSVDRVTNIRYANIGSWCIESGVPNLCSSNQSEIAAFAESLDADFCLVAGWYHMVGKDLRRRFARGAVGLHASLLPKLRGGAPLNWALLTQKPESGVSMFELGDGVDDGPIYAQERFPIAARATIANIVDQAETAALNLLERNLPAIAEGTLRPTPQVGEPSYCLQRIPGDGAINWSRSADEIDRLIRAVGRPYPGAFSYLDGQRIYIWAAQPANEIEIHGAAGQIAFPVGESAPFVVTARGAILISEATDEDGRNVLPQLKAASNRRFALNQ